MLRALRRVRDRVYSDFLMESRLHRYRQLLESVVSAGYQVSSVGGLWRLIEHGALDPARRYLVLRHDIDTDPRTAAAMWEIDRSLAVDTSYFFRLSTLAPTLMADIGEAGAEASYHYEELATVAKRRRLRTNADVLGGLPEAQDLFAANIGRLRAETGLPMRIVASHGDFVNRRFGIPNSVILADPDFREDVGVDLETYDDAFLRFLPRRYTDAPHPRYWEPKDPAAAIRDGEPVISLLVHPRHWHCDPIVNARYDVGRVIEGLSFKVPARPWRQA